MNNWTLYRRFPKVALIWAFGPALFLLLIIGLQPFVPISVLTEDTAAAAKVPLYYGAVSSIGIVLWSAATGICFFSSCNGGRSDLKWFLLATGMLTAFLALDDLFQLHESVFPRLLALPQIIVLAGYLALAFGYVAIFRKVILANELLFLLLATVFLGLSVALDVRAHLFGHEFESFFFEDGFKLLGIVSWLLYVTRLSAQTI